jgi:hypothetical protein
MTEEERARIHVARNRGGLCAACGRELVEGETIWMERIAVRGEYGDVSYWHVPVGNECVAPETVQETCKMEPERCAGCGRGVYYRTSRGRRQRALCSRACGRKGTQAASTPARRDRHAAAPTEVYDVQASGDVPPWER